MVYYKYGADGLRVQKTVDGAVHDYYYSDGLLVREVATYGYGYVEILDFLYDESGTPYSFIYGFVYNGDVYTTQYYYVKNLQNDVIAIADEYGDLVAEYTYDAWGNVLYTNEYTHDNIGYVNPIRYRSYYYDTDTGFYYLQSRYYDPAIRRFINADGYVNANGDILGFNMYAYCGNNPVMYVDYTGEISASVTVDSLLPFSFGILTPEKYPMPSWLSVYSLYAKGSFLGFTWEEGFHLATISVGVLDTTFSTPKAFDSLADDNVLNPNAFVEVTSFNVDATVGIGFSGTLELVSGTVGFELGDDISVSVTGYVGAGFSIDFSSGIKIGAGFPYGFELSVNINWRELFS